MQLPLLSALPPATNSNFWFWNQIQFFWILILEVVGGPTSRGPRAMTPSLQDIDQVLEPVHGCWDCKWGETCWGWDTWWCTSSVQEVHTSQPLHPQQNNIKHLLIKKEGRIHLLWLSLDPVHYPGYTRDLEDHRDGLHEGGWWRFYLFCPVWHYSSGSGSEILLHNQTTKHYHHLKKWNNHFPQFRD